jgi:hypothetical protein
VAVIWGALDLVFDFYYWHRYAGDGPHRNGLFIGLFLSATLLGYGIREIRSHHVRKYRVLPWIVGLKVAALIFLLGVVAGQPRYPTTVESNFLASCTASGGTAGMCACALEWFESHESLSQFVAIDAETRSTGGVPWEVRSGIASSCGDTPTT